MTESKATVFVAHSTEDIQDARLVRNLFEDRDHDVLLFKLSQKMDADFLRNLLRNEIKARDWLVVAASQNSSKSKWVKFEETYARERNKPIYYIELDDCRKYDGREKEKCLLAQIKAISQAIRVFISHSSMDRDFANKLANDLRTNGYEVWHDAEELMPGSDWARAIQDAIEQTLERGALVVLVSENSRNSLWVERELAYAETIGGRIIPCLIDPSSDRLPMRLMLIQAVDFRQSYYEGLKQLMHGLSIPYGRNAT